MGPKGWRFAVFLAAAVLWSAGCVSSESRQGNGASCGSADDIVPSSTLQDLATYADEVAVVEVVDDEALEHDEPDDGLEPERHRDATIDVVDVVWTAPQQRDVPDSITFTTGGWVGGDPDKGPGPVCDQPPLEVGHRYLVGLVEYRVGDWAPMTGPFVLEVGDDGTLEGFVDDGPLASYAGQPPAAVGAALADVEPDPAVAPFRDQPAGDRYEASLGLAEE